MNLLSKKLNNKGFTIIELIVVIAVLAILVLLAAPRFLGYTQRASEVRIKNDLRVVENKVQEYLIKYNHFNSSDNFNLGDIEEDEVVYSKEGKIDKEDLSDKGPFYRVNDLSLVKDANSKLDGTFIANDKGETFYAGKNIGGDSVVSDGGGTGYTKEEIDALIAEGYIPVATAEELAHIRLDSSEARIFGAGTEWEEEFIGKLDSKYIQVNDIDLSGYTAEGGWVPIGSGTTPFTGIYNGGSFKITGLIINRPTGSNIGLFAYTHGATIENVGLENVSVAGYERVGGLVGEAFSNTTINNSYATGTVSGENNVGGLAGNADLSTINNSYATGDVTGTGDYVGGLVGNAYQAEIINSYATGAVSGDSWVGGLAGDTQYFTTIKNSYATGDVTGTGDNVGGLTGGTRKRGITIENSYATGSVNGINKVGGLVGFFDRSTINNSYATGTVTGSSDVGGLVGHDLNSSSTATSSYYDTDTTGQSDSVLGEGRTTTEMQNQATYIGWDFTDIWQITPNNYPTLR